MSIFKRLLWSFLISTGLSMLIAGSLYHSENGFEARQGVFILLLLTAVLCLVNFLLSLMALFNLNRFVRERVLLSALAFLGLPLMLLLLLVFNYTTHRSSTDDPVSFIMLLSPSLFSTGLLSYHFYRFRQSPGTTGAS